MCRSGCKRQGYETPAVARQEVYAREPRPFTVWREQLVALLGLDPPAPQCRRELREPEVAIEAELVPAEALDAHDPDRPGPEPALTGEARDDLGGRHRLQPLELQRAAEPDQRARAPGAEAEPGELRR